MGDFPTNVAVIGNAPSEKGLGKGKVIDGFDAVIRMNNFRSWLMLKE